MSVTNYPLITGVGAGGGENSVLSFPTFADFPATGQEGIIYVDEENADLYLWDGTVYELQGGGGSTPTETHFFSRIPKFPDSLNYYLIDVDHFGSTNPAPFFTAQSGTNASASAIPYDVPGAGADTTKKAIGLFGLSGGTDVGFACISVGLASGNTGTFYVGAHAMRMGMRANLAGLSVNGDAESTYFGLWGHFNIEPVDCVMFKQNPDQNGGRWQAITRNSQTAGETIVDTGVAASDTVYQNFEIEINRAGNDAKFYINGTLVATITTNFPTLNYMVSGALRRKLSGSTFRRLVIDALYHANEKLSARG